MNILWRWHNIRKSQTRDYRKKFFKISFDIMHVWRTFLRIIFDVSQLLLMSSRFTAWSKEARRRCYRNISSVTQLEPYLQPSRVKSRSLDNPFFYLISKYTRFIFMRKIKKSWTITGRDKKNSIILDTFLGYWLAANFITENVIEYVLTYYLKLCELQIMNI